MPADVALTNRVFMNLVEVPVLFYALIAFYVATASTNSNALLLAWLYVGLRLLRLCRSEDQPPMSRFGIS